MLTIILSIILGLILSEFIRRILRFPNFLKRQKNPWVGFDLDGTIALSRVDKFNPRTIGEPIPSMIELIKKYLQQGSEVKIVTARVATDGTVRSIYNSLLGQYYIGKWCQKHIGKKLPVVSGKDFYMRTLYDDRAIEVKTDQGI